MELANFHCLISAPQMLKIQCHCGEDVEFVTHLPLVVIVMLM